jgi:hypothetical protein
MLSPVITKPDVASTGPLIAGSMPRKGASNPACIKLLERDGILVETWNNLMKQTMEA